MAYPQPPKGALNHLLKEYYLSHFEKLTQSYTENHRGSQSKPSLCGSLWDSVALCVSS